MTENKRFTYNVNMNTIAKDKKFFAYLNSVNAYRIVNELNVLNNENEELKQEKEELLDKILEYQKALSRKNIREEPHWHKYGKNDGYTAKIDLDIRFDGDVE